MREAQFYSFSLTGIGRDKVREWAEDLSRRKKGAEKFGPLKDPTD
jgi:hypothetical protein